MIVEEEQHVVLPLQRIDHIAIAAHLTQFQPLEQLPSIAAEDIEIPRFPCYRVQQQVSLFIGKKVHGPLSLGHLIDGLYLIHLQVRPSAGLILKERNKVHSISSLDMAQVHLDHPILCLILRDMTVQNIVVSSIALSYRCIEFQPGLRITV